MAERQSIEDTAVAQMAYVIHDAVCTAYRHEGRNALCERAARALRAAGYGQVEEALTDSMDFADAIRRTGKIPYLARGAEAGEGG